MSKIIKFGEEVEGYKIPVLNEREIRASAGILFLMMFIAIMVVIFKGNFILLKYAVVLFLSDILIRVFVNPRYSPFLIIGRLIVRNQVPEYVGAQQKKFAWIIGIVLASSMFVLINIVNSYSPITGIICLICLIFLFFESAFGICLGCKVYSLIYKEKAQYCPGEVCDNKSRQEIQKTSIAQILIVLGFTAYIVLIVYLFNDTLNKKPHDLFGKEDTSSVKEINPKVTGIGGIFFSSENPQEIKEWYANNLGLEINEWGSSFEFRNTNRPDEINYLEWSPFKKGAKYFEPSNKEFMINYRVQNIEGLVDKLSANGVTILDKIESFDYGKFVHIMDLEGNKIELWDPIDSVFTAIGGKTTK